MEESAAEFASSLRDLTTNSKPLISMLTMLADESREHAGKIVEAIEHYLRTSEPSIKLPSLYLIDSIVKNIGNPYVQLFTENIVRNFVLVFQEGDERVRTALFKLRQTWKDIFPERKLYALDLNTQAVDPNWPVCAAAPIHVNPKFFKKPPSELEIARGTESELKSLDERQKQLDRIQEELRRKRDEIAHKSAAALKQAQQQSQTVQPKSPLSGQPTSPQVQQPPQIQVHAAQQNRGSKTITRGHPRTKKDSLIGRPVHIEKANENVDFKDSESKKPKRFRDRDKIRKEAEKAHNASVVVNNNISTKDISPLAAMIGDPRRKQDEPHKVSSSKFRIPKKTSSSLTTARSGTEVLDEAKTWPPDSGGGRAIARKTSHHSKRRSSPPAPPRNPPATGARLTLADKEAATILTGDVDLRLFEPRAKRRKEETTSSVLSSAFPSSKEDTDLRIRPKGAISYPGQTPSPIVKGASPRENPATVHIASPTGTTAETATTTTTASVITSTASEIQKAQTNTSHSRTSSGHGSNRDPRSKKRMSPPVTTSPIETTGNVSNAGIVKDAPSLNVENVHATPLDQSTAGNALSAEQLVREAERLLRGPSATAGGTRIALSGDVHAGFAPASHKRKPDRVNLRLLNSLQWSAPAPEFGQILLDRQMRDIRFVDGVAVAVMEEAPPNLVKARLVCFRGNPRPVVINEHQFVMANFDGDDHEFTVNGNTHRVRFGAPLRELYIDGVPYSCQFDGRPIKVQSGDDVFVVALPPPCPTVCDKRPAGPELLAKLGLRPMHTLGSVPGHLGSAGPLGVSQGSPGVNGAADSGPTNSVRGVAGGWVRYQEEQPLPQVPPPPSVRPIPSLFPPPMPPNIGCPLQGPPNRFPGGPPCPPSVPPGPMTTFHSHPAFGRPQMMPPPPTAGPLDRLSGGSLPPPAPASFAQPQRMSPMNTQQITTPGSSSGQLDVSDLLSKLVEQGLISNTSSSANDASANGNNKKERDKNIDGGDTTKDQPSGKEEIPQLNFKQPALLKQRIGGVISALHEGVQCSACGQRFQQGDKSTSDKYAQHLDWHFRLKRRGREGLRKASSRKWFFCISDWIDFEEIEDLDERARNFFEEQLEVQHESNSQDGLALQSSVHELPSVEAAKLPKDVVYSCEHCHESFEKYFCEDSEDWRLRNALLVDDKLFHPICHEDYLKPVPKPVLVPAAVSEDNNAQPQSPGAEKSADLVETCVEASVPDPKRAAILDEGSQPLPGLDFDPSVEAADDPQAIKKAEESALPDEEYQPVDVKIEEQSIEEKLCKEMEGDEANDMNRVEEQSVVVVEELGEFGVNSSASVSLVVDDKAELSLKAGEAATEGNSISSQTLNDESADLKEIEPPKEELKVIVKGSGGFVLKVKQDSVVTVINADHAQSSSGDTKALDEPSLHETLDDDEHDTAGDWRPPSPDPRFKNLPPLQKGSEMSGLCSIM
ncbi:pre-mRNA cleavage complex 2 protein Pcf11-like isoform X2 [Varroa destructor]|uniref:Pre-mRNA cleavage complex 2 protein Pcf11 n=1 Tax=Varroa destructor TaxID=109461 RepID=A0A7M7JDR5_VARDE|nr:pre-mRNA cleavage complex 2 protein Pcf11-like isoform X2 [Varroa destructor]